LGRVIRFGLGAYGQQGVERVLGILQAEFRQAMREAGCANVKAIQPSVVKVNFA
jgi:isopentenyl diphosphate isomerase/L-lactate dehydrogenase-like FMN-dependent dehydrogenase